MGISGLVMQANRMLALTRGSAPPDLNEFRCAYPDARTQKAQSQWLGFLLDIFGGA
jgi:hypothetical protein